MKESKTHTKVESFKTLLLEDTPLSPSLVKNLRLEQNPLVMVSKGETVGVLISEKDFQFLLRVWAAVHSEACPKCGWTGDMEHLKDHPGECCDCFDEALGVPISHRYEVGKASLYADDT